MSETHEAIRSALKPSPEPTPLPRGTVESVVGAFRGLWEVASATLGLGFSEELCRRVVMQSVTECLESLDEIDFCVASVQERIEELVSTDGLQSSDAFIANVRRTQTRSIANEARAIRTEIERRRTTELSPLTAGLLEELRHRVRFLCKYCAAVYDIESWQSPSHRGSLHFIERGRNQGQLLQPYTHGYRRWSLGTELDKWERSFASAMYAGGNVQGRWRPVAVLTGSGMSALKLALEWAATLLGYPFTVYLPQSAYFEIRSLLRSSPSTVLPIEQLFRGRITEPFVLILEPISNEMERKWNHVDEIVRSIELEPGIKGVVVLDRSTIGPLFEPSSQFRFSQHDSIRYVYVESLLKHYQFGLELGQGGVVTVFAAEHESANVDRTLKQLRAANGLLPADIHFFSYPALDRERTVARVKRQSRNAALLAASVRGDVEASSRWGCSYPVSPSKSETGGPLVSLIHGDHEDERFYEGVITTCVTQARTFQIPVSGVHDGAQHV